MVKRLQLSVVGIEERDFAEEGQKMMTEHSEFLVLHQPLPGIVLIQWLYISFTNQEPSSSGWAPSYKWGVLGWQAAGSTEAAIAAH